MSWSLGETRALAIKAARGAGLSWGLAEEAGFSVHWLQARGAPGVAALADYLQWRASVTTSSTKALLSPSTTDDITRYDKRYDKTICPIQLGCTILDSGIALEGTYPVYQPLLLVPFFAPLASASPTRSTQSQQAIVLCWLDKEITIAANSMTSTVNVSLLLDRQTQCTVAYATDRHNRNTTATKINRVPESMRQSMQVLNDFSARTYAPATEESRLSGAGAGTTDND